MRELLVIGIGAGHPEFVTVQAVRALNRVSRFFVVDKGEDKSELMALRTQICERFIEDQDAYRIVEIPEPERDRNPADAAAYQGAVADWHDARARLFADAVRDELDDDGVGAFLVWGDPSLYDSTLRIIDRMLATVEFDYSVIPGVTAVQALTAAHRLPANRIGEPVHVTTGRRIAAGLPDGLDAAFVMLDSGLACAGIEDPDVHIYWGAYLGTPDEALLSGRLVDVAEELAAYKAQLRAKHGWIMDTYLLRRER